VVWSYCHVPAGSTVDMSDAIERQIERFAPGFRDRILSRLRTFPHDLERYNPNYSAGDVTGGGYDGHQLFARPRASLNPYRLGQGLFLCSASTPPGGGVHGMCGFHAARRAIRSLDGDRMLVAPQGPGMGN
jgi:phytoene dehydrogenase-like protein